MRKLSYLLLVVLLVTPNLVSAAWWNPFSWFKQDGNSAQQQIQQTLVRTQESVNYSQLVSKTFYVQADSTRIHDCASLTCKVIANYPVNSEITYTGQPTNLPEWVQFTFPDNNGATTTGYIKSTTLGENKVIMQKIPQTGTLCNGDYYNQCPSGQNFVCPSTGKAYCDTPKTDDQMCVDMYGSYSYFAGQKTCGCKTGYGWNSTKTSCIAVQVKNGYQSCGESFPNETWDGTYNSKGGFSCVCKNGYTWDNAQSMCVSYQQQYLQQAVDKSNSTSCLTAKQNTQTKQSEYDSLANAPEIPTSLLVGRGIGLAQTQTAELNSALQSLIYARQAENIACLP